MKTEYGVRSAFIPDTWGFTRESAEIMSNIDPGFVVIARHVGDVWEVK